MHSSDYYKRLFDALESILIQAGEQSGVGDMRQQLAEYKTVADHRLEDADYFGFIVEIIFYSGFSAATVDAKLAVVREWFPDYATVSRYESEQVQKMMADPRMIRNGKKLWACVKNARAVQAIVREYGSFQKYVESFSPKASFSNLMGFRDDVMKRFAYLAGTNSLYFLMGIGMPVLKPDIVITRIFHRLGFLEDEKISEARRLQCVEIGQRFAEATGHSIRYIDIVFVFYGQVKGDFSLSIQQGICLKTNPRCHICGVTEFCDYFKGGARPKELNAGGRPGTASQSRSLPSASPKALTQRDDTSVTIPTWGGRSRFQYTGSVRVGTWVYCGKDCQLRYEVPAEQYAAMLVKFSGQEVGIGTSFTTPPKGSLGQWLTDEFGQYGMTSYIGPILLREGYAVRGSRRDRIRFNSRP